MKILIPQYLYDGFAPDVRDIAPQVELITFTDDTHVPDGLAEAEGLYGWFGVPHLERLLEGGTHLRWVQTASAGVDRLIPTFRKYPNVTFTESGTAFDVSIPEYVLAWMLVAARRVPQFIEQMKAHVWKQISQVELCGGTVGVIGLGPIGRGVAERCKALGMRTLGYRRSPESVPAVDEVLTCRDGLVKLLAESDYVVICTALTDETRNLIGAPELARMKPEAWIVNIARGAVIDEPALITALQTGVIAGACLDVFQQEPLPTESPLWDMPNVFITPHNSPDSTGTQAKQKQVFLTNLRHFVNGEPLENVVDAVRGY